MEENRQDKKLLVMHNFNQSGGFCWQAIYCVIMAKEMANKNNLKLVICLDSGLYYEDKKEFQEKYKDHIDLDCNEWFSYYFESIGIHEPHIKKLWKQGLLNNLPNLTKYDKDNLHEIGYIFDRETYEKRNNSINFREIYKSTIHTRPYIKKMIDDFADEHFKGKFMIGIHIRGSDKFPSLNDDEDGPIHFTYEKYAVELLKRYEIEKLKHPKVAIFVCSDEQSAVHFIMEFFKKRNIECISTGNSVIRSDVNTSGINFDVHKCVGSANLVDPDCIFYHSLPEKSIHRGMKHLSSFKKGLDVALETNLLAKCNIFYRSRGNFSSCVLYMNPSISSHDMVLEFDRK